jgi:ribonuclease HI
MNDLHDPLANQPTTGRVRKPPENNDDDDGDDRKPMKAKKRNLNEAVVSNGDITRESMKYFYDGACRNNGKKEVVCAIGVYPMSYKSPYCVSKIVNVKTNNEAEICAATETIMQMIEEHKQTGCKTGEIWGDSNLVWTTMIQGRIHWYTSYGKENFNKHWLALKEVWDEATIKYGISIKWEWIPRSQNMEADELCNAALDVRDVNESIHSATQIFELDITQICNALEMCKRRRVKAPRTLSLSLVKPWLQFLQSILLLQDKTKSRLLFWLAPALLVAVRCFATS